MRVAMLKADVLSRNDSNGHWQAKHCILNQRNPNDSASEPNERKTEHWTINGDAEEEKKMRRRGKTRANEWSGEKKEQKKLAKSHDFLVEKFIVVTFCC